MPAKKKSEPKRIRRYILDEDGVQRWYQGYSEKDLEEAKQKLLLDLKTQKDAYQKITFRNWVSKWQRIYRASETLSARRDTDGRLKNYVYPVIGNMQMHAIKPLHLQTIFASCQGKSASFNHKLYITLNQIFRAAVDNDIIAKSPMRGISKPKGPSGSNRALTQAERESLLDACNGDNASTFCLLSLYCGLRPSESAALTWDDVDLRESLISINKALKRDGYIGDTKSPAGVRQVPIPAPFLAYLKNHAKESGYVVTNTRGNPLSKTSMRYLWELMKERMKAPEDLTLYCLRHTYCTDLELAGVPLNIAKVLMGHDDVKVTAKIYTHTGIDAIQSARVLIDNMQTEKRASI